MLSSSINNNRQGPPQIFQVADATWAAILFVSSHNVPVPLADFFWCSAVVMIFFANLAVITSPSIHYPVEHYMLAGTYLSFTNIMACRAFRGIALGQLEDDTPHVGLTSTKINAAFQLEPLPHPTDPHGRRAA